ncbi:hypothetical protein B0H15DRAFT_935570 [Mycena belliarum]|uniref:HNH nuclease domain-containing protein n=1 Tax=Mycena belliarum TaxID=1033014 RepID=A0AAD6UQ06_9AGAR|nr:hypothetical protein B0H15DRAFT_935570 [Mycena belliae]
MPQPLPSNPFAKHTPEWDAYNSCLHLEALTSWSVDDLNARIADPSLEGLMLAIPPQVAGRTLGYALFYAPSDTGRACVAEEIVACTGDLDTLASLAHLYIFGLIRIFRNPKGATPTLSADQTPDPCFLWMQGHRDSLILPGDRPPSLKKKARHSLLLRDQYRCVFTGHIDRSSFDKAEQNPSVFPELAPFFVPDAPAVSGESLHNLDIAHIISQSLTDRIGGISKAAIGKLNWACSVSAILDRFSGIQIQELLGGTDLHSASNGFMASHHPHTLFNRLDFCLIPAKDAQDQIITNVYDVDYLYRRRDTTIRERVIFSERNLNGEIIPPPSPILLGLHAASARVAHMSGAAAVLGKFDGDPDTPTSRVLTQGLSMQPDPIAMHELNQALLKLGVVHKIPVHRD